MRAMPNMVLMATADSVETRKAVKAAVAYQGPVYLRTIRCAVPTIFDDSHDFQIGKAITVREGSDATFIATGGMLLNTVQAAEHLKQHGIKVSVLSMHTIKPLDADSVLAEARRTGVIITIEEHSIIGGLGSAVAEVLAESSN